MMRTDKWQDAPRRKIQLGLIAAEWQDLGVRKPLPDGPRYLRYYE